MSVESAVAYLSVGQLQREQNRLNLDLIKYSLDEEWRSQPLRPTRELSKEFEAQESLMEPCKFDKVFYPTWSIDDDAHRYINIYRSIVNARKGAA